MLGWEPEERHEHFDADGNLTGWTVVTREPEWDDTQRARMLALRLYENGICACGLHESVIGNPDVQLTPETKRCPVCAGVEQFKRHLAEQDRKHDEQHKGDGPTSPRPADGRTVRLRALSEAEVNAQRDFQEKRKRVSSASRRRSPRT